MFTLILFLLILLPVTFLPLAMDRFSSSELNEMGVCLDETEMAQPECPFLQSNSGSAKLILACGHS